MSKLHKKTIQRYYSKRARNYDKQKSRTWKSELGFEAKIINEIVSAVSQARNGLILEVGVGSGRVALSLMKETPSRLIGLDLSREMLQSAQMKMTSCKQKLNLLMGDAEHLPFCNNIFDTLICISTFHYFSSPKIILEEFSRVLKEKGVFIYGDVTMHELDQDNFLDQLEKTISPAHAKYSRPLEMKKLLESWEIQVKKMEVIPYKKLYSALIEDKAQYFNIKPQSLYEKLSKATKNEKNLYDIEEDQMTLFYTLIKGIKQNF
ncbi:MAG: class I SAM-dependent methyltransferase [Promethearchaeota archaeon]